MLAIGIFVLMPASAARSLFGTPGPEKNLVEELLDLPAPPPPNPLEPARPRDESFYDPKNPPPDDAPIQDLIDYWSHFRENYRGVLYYIPKPSARVVERLLSEGGPAIIPEVLDLLPDDKLTGDAVKQLYDDASTPKELRARLKHWLSLNSSYFADDTLRSASLVRDVDRYVPPPSQNALLALARHDWDQARPVVDRLYNDRSQPVSRALATWALYRHAMDSGDLGDTDRYRSELMRMVEDRTLADGVRDMANDAIVREADFPGRDDWCWSLFEDETLVNMPYFTGLTTLIMYAPPDKYVAKMTEFLKSNNKTVRTAAARNLMTAMEREKSPDIVRALLPWLADPKWLDRAADDGSRLQLVMYLQNVKMPESVPALISALDERATRKVADYLSEPTMVGNIAVYRSSNVNAAVNSANSAQTLREETYYPLREYAVKALATQADPRAVPALRRLLALMSGYQRVEVMRAILACGGYSVTEQVDALEHYARTAIGEYSDVGNYTNTSTQYYISNRPSLGSTVDPQTDTRLALGMLVASITEPSDELIRAAIARVEQLQKKDPQTSENMRSVISLWKGLAISALLLNDLKIGKIKPDGVIRLLAERKMLRESLQQDVYDVHNGTPAAAGISGCLTEDAGSFNEILESRSMETRAAFLACARLVRLRLPLDKVSAQLRSADQLLKASAEQYLVSEDSPAARAIVYSLHPGEPTILGATAFFKGRSSDITLSPELVALFGSVNSAVPVEAYMPFYNGVEWDKEESKLQQEIKSDADLIGLYSYEDNVVRIHKDRVSLSWGEDPLRYRERELGREEFDRLKGLLAAYRVSEMKPFLVCGSNCGAPSELVMIGKNGGSRVFNRTSSAPFFNELEKLLSQFRAGPSTFRYSLSRELPGLEILFADDDLEAQTVWKEGGDLRIAVSDPAVREKVEDEISELEQTEESDSSEDEEDAPDETVQRDEVAPSEKMRFRRQYEGFGWFGLQSGKLASAVPQPAGFEYIPARDGFNIQPTQQQWKSRAAGVEIRADESGLYKIAGGRLTKLKDGNYSDPVLSTDGRWLVVNKFDADAGPVTLRYDLATNREIKIQFDGGNLTPRCYLPAAGKFLLISGYFDEENYGPMTDEEDSEADGFHRFVLLDAVTGTVTTPNGEFRPFAQQTFRPLQSTGRANEYWAAVPGRGRTETIVGTIDSRLFRFKPVLRLPKISFTSLDMWVVEAENKVYFVYGGHVLRIPLVIVPQR